MSERILQVVEEVKEASVALASIRKDIELAEVELNKLDAIHLEAKQKYEAAERKLRGVIYEETQT